MFPSKFTIYLILLIGFIFTHHDAFAGAPKELLGKSLIMAWSESREQRPLGEQNWRIVSGTSKWNLYVGTTGKVFRGGTTTTRGGTAKLDEKIAGDAKGLAANFSGRSLTILAGPNKHVRRISIEFNESFTDCTAQVTFAKQHGEEISQEYSNIIHHMNEIKGAKISGVSCSVQAGNVLAE